MSFKSKALTTTEVSQAVKEWAPGLKDFALTEFNQQNFFKSAILAITESDQLMECMATAPGRESLYNAMKRAFSTGLSLNPQEGKACIIAYKGKASYQIMKEGAIDIVLDSGDVKTLMVEIVYENDAFGIEKSNAGDVYHFSPARRDRGNVDGYFCCITDMKGISHVKYLTEQECFEIRDNHSTSFKFSKETSPWTKSEKGMCKKTVIKTGIRDLYLSPSAKSRFAAEDFNTEDNKPPMKDITPIAGSSASDVAAKLKKEDPKPPAEEKKTDEPSTNETSENKGQF